MFCVDSSESELGILDLIQVFVETLDKCFENVCELDLIFHVDKVILSLIYKYIIIYYVGIQKTITIITLTSYNSTVPILKSFKVLFL